MHPCGILVTVGPPTSNVKVIEKLLKAKLTKPLVEMTDMNKKWVTSRRGASTRRGGMAAHAGSTGIFKTVE